MTQIFLALASFAILPIQGADRSTQELSGYETTKHVGDLTGGGLRVTFTTTDKSTGEQCSFVSTYTSNFGDFEPYQASFDSRSNLHSAHLINISLINLEILKSIAPKKVKKFLTTEATCYKPAINQTLDPVPFLLTDEDDKKNQS